MKDVMKKQRQARRKIIRQWTMLPRDKRQSDQIAAFAKTAARENENAFVHSRRDPHEKIIAVRNPVFII
jgi:CRISPR/Cas system Type II protein with McrA/HNH and RuvC-like nuclease domain